MSANSGASRSTNTAKTVVWSLWILCHLSVSDLPLARKARLLLCLRWWCRPINRGKRRKNSFWRQPWLLAGWSRVRVHLDPCCKTHEWWDNEGFIFHPFDMYEYINKQLSEMHLSCASVFWESKHLRIQEWQQFKCLDDLFRCLQDNESLLMHWLTNKQQTAHQVNYRMHLTVIPSAAAGRFEAQWWLPSSSGTWSSDYPWLLGLSSAVRKCPGSLVLRPAKPPGTGWPSSSLRQDDLI